MNKQLFKEQIEAQVKNDPRDQRHSITFVNMDRSEKVYQKCIVVSVGVIWIMDPKTNQMRPIGNEGILEWLDENDVHHLTPMANFYDIYFDKQHRKLIEKSLETSNQESQNAG